MPETDNDPSGSTASFRAFAQRSDDEVVSGRRAPANRAVIIAVVVVCVAIVIGIIAAMG
ncbi:MAG TPA: hypothetical protein VE733_03610 [Streptosporangiaceae bacterium]|jgi:ABC-type spermidine/putrescine transport system permease subunit II|nr:hypothetical protein [Streptosporangiaceae bacterium]